MALLGSALSGARFPGAPLNRANVGRGPFAGGGGPANPSSPMQPRPLNPFGGQVPSPLIPPPGGMQYHSQGQRIGYFGPHSGGIITLPPSPQQGGQDPILDAAAQNAAAQNQQAQMQQQQSNPFPAGPAAEQQAFANAANQMKMNAQAQPSLSHILAAAAAAHPQSQLYPQMAGGQDPGLARLALLRALGHPHVESNSSYEAHVARNRAAQGRPQFSY